MFKIDYNSIFNSVLSAGIYAVLVATVSFLRKNFKNDNAVANRYTKIQLQKSFYICFFIMTFVFSITIYNSTLSDFWKALVIVIYFWSSLFGIFAFESSIDQMNNNSGKK